MSLKTYIFLYFLVVSQGLLKAQSVNSNKSDLNNILLTATPSLQAQDEELRRTILNAHNHVISVNRRFENLRSQNLTFQEIGIILNLRTQLSSLISSRNRVQSRQQRLDTENNIIRLANELDSIVIAVQRRLTVQQNNHAQQSVQQQHNQQQVIQQQALQQQHLIQQQQQQQQQQQLLHQQRVQQQLNQQQQILQQQVVVQPQSVHYQFVQLQPILHYAQLSNIQQQNQPTIQQQATPQQAQQQESTSQLSQRQRNKNCGPRGCTIS